MLARALLLGLLALASISSQAWATGPAYYPPGGGGGSGDVETVGDCTGPACFEGTTGNSLQFEGSTADGFETTLTAIDPTADRTISLPNIGGVLAIKNIGTSLPATCTAGESYFDSDARCGQQEYVCTATDTWSLVEQSRFYNLICYGADPTGVAASDTAIADWLAAPGTNKRAMLYAPAGTYKHANSITIGTDAGDRYGTIVGDGIRLTKFNYTGSAYAFDLTSASGFDFRDFSVSTSASATGTFRLTDSNYIQFANLSLDGASSTGTGFRLDTSSSTTSHNRWERIYLTQLALGFDFNGNANSNLLEDLTFASSVTQAISMAADTNTILQAEILAGNPAILIESTADRNSFISVTCDGPTLCLQADSGNTGNSFFNHTTTTAFTGTGVGALAIYGSAWSDTNADLDADQQPFGTKFGDSDQSNFVSVVAPGTVASDWTLTLPTTDGDANQFLQTNGSGVSTWAAETGDVSSVGDCTTGACFTGASGTTLTASGTMSLLTPGNMYVRVDTDADADGAFVVATGAGSAMFEVNEDGASRFYSGTDLRLYETDNTNYVQLSAPTLGGNWTLTLPADDGNSGQFLQTDGSGTTTWATPSGSGNVSNTGTPADNQVAVWTDATTIEGTSGLTFSAGTLTATTFSGALSGNATTATTAGAGDSATAFFSSGTIEAARLPDADDDATTKGIITLPNAQFDCTAGSCSIATGGIGSTELADTFSATTITSNLVGNVTGNADTATLAATATTANAGDSATSFFSSGELERTLLPAASADCSANQFAKGVDADFVLDCAQPAFTDISGTAAATQITKINSTSCTSGVQTAADGTVSCMTAASTPEYVSRVQTAGGTILAYGVVKANSTTSDGVVVADSATTTRIVGCSQDADGSVSTDPVEVAVSGIARCATDTGVAVNDQVTLGATDGKFYTAGVGSMVWGEARTSGSGGTAYIKLLDPTTGYIDHPINLMPNAPDYTASGMGSLTFNPDIDVSGDVIWHSVFRVNPVIHIGQASALFGAISALSTVDTSSSGTPLTILHDDSTSSNLPGIHTFWNGGKVTTSVAVAAPTSYGLLDQMLKQGTGAITVPSGGTHRTVSSTIQFKAISSATATYAEGTGLYYAPTIGTDNGASDGTALTLTESNAVKVVDATNDGGAGTETLTTQNGVNCGTLTAGGTNSCIKSSVAASGTAQWFLNGTGTGLSRLGGRTIVGSTSANPAATMHVTEPTVGNEVLRVESVATNDDPNYRIFQMRTTAAASGTTNLDFPLTTAAPTDAPCASSKVCIVEASVICHCTSGSSCTANDGGAIVTRWPMKNNGGTFTQLGAAGSGNVVASAISGSSLTSLTQSISGTNFRTAIVVPANFNHTCHATFIVQSVGT